MGLESLGGPWDDSRIGRKYGSLLVLFSTSPFSRSSADPTITGHDATINTTLKGEMALTGMVMMLGAKKDGWADDGGTDDTRIRHEKNWTRTIKITKPRKHPNLPLNNQSEMP